jgi:hypothetical protein
MDNQLPIHIPISHDDYHAKHIGHTSDNRQFFLTNPFVWKLGNEPGREFLALYIFDAGGNLLEAKIEDLGVRKSQASPPGNKLDLDVENPIIQTRLSELGSLTFGDIAIKPFKLERFGVEFGLIPQAPEEEDEDWTVNIEPGDYMAFYPPWDGDYDT